MAVGDTIRLAVRNCLALALARWNLLVGLDVEIDEEAKVAGEQNAAEDCGALCSSASTEVGDVGEVIRGIVVVCYVTLVRINRTWAHAHTGEVHGKQIDNELCDLHGGQVLLPLGDSQQAVEGTTAKRHVPRSSHHQQSHSSSSLAFMLAASSSDTLGWTYTSKHEQPD